LFWRVMRVGLSTGPCARRPGSGLSGRIFSGPVDCIGLVNFFQGIEEKREKSATGNVSDLGPTCSNRTGIEPQSGTEKRAHGAT
jgi:hypothetical protein